MRKSPAKAVKLSQERMYEIIRSPVITEKATLLSEFNQVSFHVPLNAVKPEIKAAVEGLFSVKVTAVNVMTVHGKERRMGRRQVRTPAWRKAIVTLQVGDKIELFENV